MHLSKKIFAVKQFSVIIRTLSSWSVCIAKLALSLKLQVILRIRLNIGCLLQSAMYYLRIQKFKTTIVKLYLMPLNLR